MSTVNDQFCMSLMSAENREKFKANERTYLEAWQLTDAQMNAVLTRNYLAMMAEGANIYFLTKIGATDGLPFQSVAASMSGLSPEAYSQPHECRSRFDGAALVDVWSAHGLAGEGNTSGRQCIAVPTPNGKQVLRSGRSNRQGR
jgi:protocatechuate 4,5-dioxygenase alpha subunit